MPAVSSTNKVNTIMKKIITILCIFSLALTLFGCGGKPRYAENYSVGEYGDGWSILYTDEDGVEEIVALGKTPQPLALEIGRLYFTDGGKLVSVDPDGRDRQETVIGTMNETGVITYADAENFYCLEADSTRKCWRISKADPADHAEIDVPYELRGPVDYADLLQQIRQRVSAEEDLIHLRSARAVMDSCGNLLSLDLELLYYLRYSGAQMKVWNTARVVAQFTPHGTELQYIKENLNFSVSDKTINRMVALDAYLTALETVDTSRTATARASDGAEEFRIMYQVSEYEACVAGNKANLTYIDPTGNAVDANEKVFHLVLAQVGGCETMLTDSEGTACGNLTVIQLG